jgi:DNA-binding NtrC family response regulator
MRKMRALIFDDEISVLELLEKFLTRKDYEVCAFSAPAVCPIHKDDDVSCMHEKTCADVLITDYNMPGMNGLDLIALQQAKGCRIDIRNKAIISGFLEDKDLERLSQFGCAFFKKPFHLSMLSSWLETCGKRVDLSAPLAHPRREGRKKVNVEITYTSASHASVSGGVVTNISDSGFCLRTDRNLAAEEILSVKTGLPDACRTASVRWTRITDDNACVAGLHRVG